MLDQHGGDIPASVQEVIAQTLVKLGACTSKLSHPNRRAIIDARLISHNEHSGLSLALGHLAQLESSLHAIRRLTTPRSSTQLAFMLDGLVGEIDSLRTICRVRARQIAGDAPSFATAEGTVTLH
jgi:hypothetical protein